MERNRSLPIRSWLFFLIAAFFMLLPAIGPRYKGYTGKALVALSKNDFSMWQDTLLYVVKDSWAGTVAIILNRPFDPAVDKAPAYLLNKGISLYVGGPLEQEDRVFVMEIQGGKMTVAKLDDLQAKNPDILTKIVASIKGGEAQYRIFVGYAGWVPFQLFLEKGQEDWGIVNFNKVWLDLQGHDMWDAGYRQFRTEHPPRMPKTI